jgi:Concanavalin A-like lectin/glucanases superfamily/Secretion system C-terminal sorting domain/The GLUG motif
MVFSDYILRMSRERGQLHRAFNSAVNLIEVILLTAAIALSAATGAVAQTAVQPSGSGTAGDPYLVANLSNLYWIAEDSTRWGYDYVQSADINAAETSTWSGGGWITIGDGIVKFTGTYDGQGFTIDSLYINRSASYQALFGSTDGAEIDSVGVTNVNITVTSGGQSAGGLIAYSYNTVVRNCYSTGSVSCAGSWAGGLAAEIHSSSFFNNDYTTCNVNGNGSLSDYVGGFVGDNEGSTISGCYSEGSVSASGNYVGGLVGYLQAFSVTAINNSYCTGSVRGHVDVGGLVGWNYNSTVSSSYSTGVVSAISGSSSNLGGLVGANSGTVSNCFWDTTTSGQSTSAGGTGESTAAMKTESTFLGAGWDFHIIWAINNGYPYLINLRTYAEQATNVTRSTATMNGLVNPENDTLTVAFQYGTTSGVYTNSTASSPGTVSGTGVGTVSASLTGLTSGTIYYYRVMAVSSSPADTFLSGERSFMTISNIAGNVLLFNPANSDYVSVPDDSSLDFTANYTIEAWIRPTSFTSLGGIVSKYNSNNSNGYFLRLTGSTPYTGIDFDGVVTASGILTAGTWYHIAAVDSSGTHILYVNGAKVPLTGTAITVQSNTDPLTIGLDYLPAPRYFDGEISEVRIWNIARSQPQIQSTMNSTLMGTEAGLAAYWQLDGSGTNETAYEDVGGQNGTLNNFTFSGDGWVPSTDLSLPVQATDFVATTDNSSVTLSWKTQSEVDIAGFVVKRQLSGLSTWQLAGSYTTDNSLAGLGTSSSGRSYSFTDDKVISGETYIYKIQSVSTNGITEDLSTLSVTVDVPKTYALYQNFPNPFNPSTTIRFDLKEQSTVMLDIYNVLGQRVMERSYGTMNAGKFNEVVNMDGFASGVYFYRVVAEGIRGDSFVAIKKMLELK